MNLNENLNNLSITNLFFELIHVSIGTEGCLSHTPSVDEWGKLYDTTKKQSLVGICFAGVQKLQAQSQCPPEMLYLQWMGMAAKIQQRNEVVNQQCVELQERLKADGFLLNEIMLLGNFGKHDEKQRGLYASKWNSFWMVHFKTFRLWRFDHWAWFWSPSPICRIKGFVWRKVNGYK